MKRNLGVICMILAFVICMSVSVCANEHAVNAKRYEGEKWRKIWQNQRGLGDNCIFISKNTKMIVVEDGKEPVTYKISKNIKEVWFPYDDELILTETHKSSRKEFKDWIKWAGYSGCCRCQCLLYLKGKTIIGYGATQ